MRAVSAEEQKALEAGHCEHVPTPQSLSSCNTHLPCPADWSVASWSKASPKHVKYNNKNKNNKAHRVVCEKNFL